MVRQCLILGCNFTLCITVVGNQKLTVYSHLCSGGMTIVFSGEHLHVAMEPRLVVYNGNSNYSTVSERVAIMTDCIMVVVHFET